MNFKNLLLPLLAEFILLNSQEITEELEVTSSMNGATSFYEGIQNNTFDNATKFEKIDNGVIKIESNDFTKKLCLEKYRLSKFEKSKRF